MSGYRGWYGLKNPSFLSFLVSVDRKIIGPTASKTWNGKLSIALTTLHKLQIFHWILKWNEQRRRKHQNQSYLFAKMQDINSVKINHVHLFVYKLAKNHLVQSCQNYRRKAEKTCFGLENWIGLERFGSVCLINSSGCFLSKILVVLSLSALHLI